jgi:hypothetical protein
LREFLDLEREKRDYYEKLLLTKAGILHETVEEITSVENYPSIRSANTLSTLRKMAIAASREKASYSKEAVDRFETAVAKKSE